MTNSGADSLIAQINFQTSSYEQMANTRGIPTTTTPERQSTSTIANSNMNVRHSVQTNEFMPSSRPMTNALVASQMPYHSIRSTTHQAGQRLATSSKDRGSTVQQRNRRYMNAVNAQPIRDSSLRAKVILGSSVNVIPPEFAQSLGPAYNATGFLPSVYQTGESNVKLRQSLVRKSCELTTNAPTLNGIGPLARHKMFSIGQPNKFMKVA